MKQASGYVTDDGTFYEREVDAQLHETENRLRHRLAEEFHNLNQEMFFTVVFTIMPALRSYINAHDAAHPDVSDPTEDENRGEDQPDTSEASDSLGHVSASEESIASLLKLSVGRPSHVPDVGGGSRTEALPDGGSVNGSGGGGVDASDVRSGEDMATGEGSKAARARIRRREKDI